jgi:molybdenum cofactor cytidylyltransferase
VIDAAAIAALVAAGIGHVTIARLEEGDIGEDAAAGLLAAALAGEGLRVDRPFTGRANLHAEAAGVLVVDRAGIDALNRVDEAVTLATLPAFRHVEAGELVATVKIIPFAVPGAVFATARGVIAAPLLRIAPFRLKRVGVVSTVLPGLHEKVIDKTLRVTAARLSPMGAAIIAERRVEHSEAAVAAALRDMAAEGAELVLVFGASAIADRRDVIPAALEAAGGAIVHFGMPVDPGNLLLVGSLGAVPVLGAPGCARSAKENGFDWVLARLMAGLSVTRADIMGLGVGGLLMEIASRPQPRTGREEAPSGFRPTTPENRIPLAENPISDQGFSPSVFPGSRSDPPETRLKIAAVVLAAGRSTRMGGPNKLLEDLGGRPLVRHAVEAALASHARPVMVVVGHQQAQVRAALAGLPVTLVDNAAYAEGLSSSIRAGIMAVPETADGALILLGDMPDVAAALIDRLIAAFDPARGALVVVPSREGRRGNPVVWARRFFADLARLSGDVGARHLIAAHAESVAEVAVSREGAFRDVDTPEALDLARTTRHAARGG